jgi:hypothetical protein
MKHNDIILKSVKVNNNNNLDEVPEPPIKIYFSYDTRLQYSMKKERIIKKIKERFPGHILFDPFIVRKYMKKQNCSALTSLARQFDAIIIWQDGKHLCKTSLSELRACQLYDRDCYRLKYRKHRISIKKIQNVRIKYKSNISLIIKTIKNVYKLLKSKAWNLFIIAAENGITK